MNARESLCFIVGALLGGAAMYLDLAPWAALGQG